jgi:hypothetical protein
LSRVDLEHFILPVGVTLAHFKIGHASLADKKGPSWPSTLLPLVPLWIGVFRRKRQPDLSPEQPAGCTCVPLPRSTPGSARLWGR